MTTTARPAMGQPRRGTYQVLLVAGLSVVVVVALTTLVAALVSGSDGALGALVGGLMTFGFVVFGSFVVETATRVAPQTAMMMALLTYTLQVSLVALLFVVLTSSGLVGTSLSAGWLAVGVVGATVAWTLAQLLAASRARILAYDSDLPGPSQAPSRTASVPHEVGAA